MSCWPWACRRDAPPGFRAAPRAVFAVTAIRLQSLTSSRLRRCALCLPPGDRHKAIPAALCLAPLQDRRTGLRRIGQTSAPPQWAVRWGYASICCGRLCECVPSSTLAVLSSRHEGRFTDMRLGLTLELPRHASSTAPQGWAGSVPACRRGVGLARVRARAGKAFMRGCRVDHASFRCGSAQGVLVSL